jgi:predicted porin
MNKLSKVRKAALAVLCLGAACLARAEPSSVTFYGSLDQYLIYMSSSSGKHLLALEDGQFLRTRLGLRGREELGNGYAATFQLEHGLNATNGAAADSTRLFDRRAWVGMITPVGEFRAGRQNTAVFYFGDYTDFTSRTLGSVVNAFGVPARYDNDLSFRSLKVQGFELELHANLPGTTDGITSGGFYQAALEYVDVKTWRAGYGSLTARAPAGSVQSDSVRYHHVYANYDHGKGKIYATFIRTNNDTSAGTGTNFLNSAGAILGTTGAPIAGTDPNVKRFFNIIQLSADVFITPELRLGALAGCISDRSGTDHDAKGGAIASYYALAKRTQLIAMISTLNNNKNAGFRPAGSAGLNPTFNASSDVNGQTIRTYTFGIQHKF